MLVNARRAGSTFPDLREESGTPRARPIWTCSRSARWFPVELLYAEVVEAVRAAKRGLDPDAPVHLFGAGHPMMLALAVAAGCDLFDSAAYALMARDGRYLTVSGTEHLEDMEYFPARVPSAPSTRPRSSERWERRGQRRPVRGAAPRRAQPPRHLRRATAREGRDPVRKPPSACVDRRARGHPMLDGFRVPILLDHADELERTDPVSKDAFFYTSHESARRPEVSRHHDRLRGSRSPTAFSSPSRTRRRTTITTRCGA